MQQMYNSLLNSINQKSQTVKISSIDYKLKCHFRLNYASVEISVNQLIETDLAPIFDDRLIQTMVSMYDDFYIDIKYQSEIDIGEKTDTSRYMIHRIHNSCYIDIEVSGENKWVEHPFLMLLSYHVNKCFSTYSTYVALNSNDLWVRKNVYDLYMSTNMVRFKCQSITMEKENNRHILSILDGSNISYINKDIDYLVYYEEPKSDNDDRYIHAMQQIVNLKMNELHSTRLVKDVIAYPEHLRKMKIHEFHRDDFEADTFKRNIMFTDKLIISSFVGNFDQRAVFDIFRAISGSHMRKLSIQDVEHIQPSFADFNGLKDMANLVHLKIEGDPSQMNDGLFGVLLESKALQVFKSNYSLPQDKHQSPFFQQKQNSMFHLKVKINGYQPEYVEQFMSKFPQLTNFYINMHQSRSVPHYLYNVLVSTEHNKISQMRYFKADGTEKTILSISNLFNFDSHVRHSDTIQDNELRFNNSRNDSIYDLLKRYNKGRTLAHYFARHNNSDYMNDEKMRQLEGVEEISNRWLPSTYLSLHGNPIVQTMFNQINPNSGLGDLDIYILGNIFSFVSTSIWDETMLCNITRVNKNFQNAAIQYRNTLICQTYLRNGIIKSEPVITDTKGKKRKREQEFEDFEDFEDYEDDVVCDKRASKKRKY